MHCVCSLICKRVFSHNIEDVWMRMVKGVRASFPPSWLIGVQDGCPTVPLHFSLVLAILVTSPRGDWIFFSHKQIKIYVHIFVHIFVIMVKICVKIGYGAQFKQIGIGTSDNAVNNNNNTQQQQLKFNISNNSLMLPCQFTFLILVVGY